MDAFLPFSLFISGFSSLCCCFESEVYLIFLFTRCGFLSVNGAQGVKPVKEGLYTPEREKGGAK